MSYIILIDTRTNDLNITPIENDNDRIMVFNTKEEAFKTYREHPLCQQFPTICLNIDDCEVVTV